MNPPAGTRTPDSTRSSLPVDAGRQDGTLHNPDPTRILAIDPGNTESGWVLIDPTDCQPIEFGKTENSKLRQLILCDSPLVDADLVVIEMVASYGMAVGKDVFGTCVWIGKFAEAVRGNWYPFIEPKLVYRRDIKLHHCHNPRAKDANITQALVDRFAPGEPNRGKGTKAAPGWFYGFKADIWQAYALAVYIADTRSSNA
ncbi:hypothetical protein ACHIPZ_13740 [Antrihabitans sp. NCIMB 15449]|uniref:Uncharacterized protein n=1 Tax=Antrihabitans spumae TaxID=3373370 RepID=A0ABW7JMP6_9NOCA